jgi:deoxycytidine triphosphate deaminase
VYLNSNMIRAMCIQPVLNTPALIDNFIVENCKNATVDLRLGRRFKSPTTLNIVVKNAEGNVVSTHNGYDVDLNDYELAEGQYIEVALLPSQVMLCHSVEYFNLPPTLMGQVAMRSTWARKWLNHSKADLIKPGFSGTITYELANNGPDLVYIKAGECVMQIAFAMMMGSEDVPYNGRYNFQQHEVSARED